MLLIITIILLIKINTIKNIENGNCDTLSNNVVNVKKTPQNDCLGERIPWKNHFCDFIDDFNFSINPDTTKTTTSIIMIVKKIKGKQLFNKPRHKAMKLYNNLKVK